MTYDSGDDGKSSVAQLFLRNGIHSEIIKRRIANGLNTSPAQFHGQNLSTVSVKFVLRGAESDGSAQSFHFNLAQSLDDAFSSWPFFSAMALQRMRF